MEKRYKSVDRPEAGVLINEITKRPQMESRFPQLFRASKEVLRLNTSLTEIMQRLQAARELYLNIKEQQENLDQQRETAILAQAEAYMKEVLGR